MPSDLSLHPRVHVYVYVRVRVDGRICGFRRKPFSRFLAQHTFSQVAREKERGEDRSVVAMVRNGRVAIIRA